MSSIQQVAMATVCLVAAFTFGSYINQSQIDQSAQQVDSTSPDSLHSLNAPELEIQKIQSSTPWMKPKLSARLPMPPLSGNNSGFGFSQPVPNGGEIPPPSDLSGRTKPTQNSLANSFSIAPNTSGLVTNSPSFATSGESSMPVITKQNLGGSPNLADSMRAPFQTNGFEDTATAENAPVFAVAEVTAEALPTPQSNRTLTAPVIGKAPAFPNLNQRTQPFIAAKPTLPDRQITAIPSFATARETAQQPTVIRDPTSSFETSTRDQFRYSNPQRDTGRDQNSLMPIPRLDQAVMIDDPGGAFGNRDSRDMRDRDSRQRDLQSNWSNSNKSTVAHDDSDYYPERTQQQPFQPQRRVTRLPLRLNSTAQSKLTRLRDNTIQKISLSTTQFTDYVVQRDDSLQSIANRYFGKPDYYLDIYLANRDRLRFPGDLREGMSIKIPVYEQ